MTFVPNTRGSSWQLDLLAKALDRYPQVSGFMWKSPGTTMRAIVFAIFAGRIFQELYGEPLVEHLDSLEAQDFRCLGTSAFMVEALPNASQAEPEIRAFNQREPDWRRDRRMLARDWARWAKMGWLDYYLSQTATTDTAVFKRELSQTLKDLNGDCAIFPVMFFTWSGGTNTVAESLRQIEAARELGAGGVFLFPVGSFTEELYAALRKGPFRLPAALPILRRPQNRMGGQ